MHDEHHQIVPVEHSARIRVALHSRFGVAMSTVPPKRRPTAGKETERSERLAHPLGGGSEAAEGIHGLGTTAGPDASTTLEGRRTGVSERDGAERAGSEPLLERSVEHRPGYGGEGGAPRTSADERECLDADGTLKSES